MKNESPFCPDTQTPLAESMRPQYPDDLVGQEAIWSEDSPLRKLCLTGRVRSIILWGPPGTGKTSLAHLVAKTSHKSIRALSAVHAGVKDIRAVLQESAQLKSDTFHNMDEQNKGILLFLDEIHRLSRSQQDVLLPALEQGLISFIGATTENPSFEVNAAILSRSLVFKLEKLAIQALIKLLKKATDRENHVHQRHLCLSEDVLLKIAQSADGDGRRALGILEALFASLPEGHSTIDIENFKALALSLGIRHDANGDQHFDILSALIKSIRASDPDGATYYLARLLYGGEDPMLIARRLVIAASEDIGNANPTGLLIANAAMQAVHGIGMPEARIILAQATTYLASSPKSNRAYIAINKALDDVKATGCLEVPLHLRNAHSALMQQFGYGKDYIYAHDHPKAAAQVCNLPDELADKRYYEPLDIGTESQIKLNLAKLKTTNC